METDRAEEAQHLADAHGLKRVFAYVKEDPKTAGDSDRKGSAIRMERFRANKDAQGLVQAYVPADIFSIAKTEGDNWELVRVAVEIGRRTLALRGWRAKMAEVAMTDNKAMSDAKARAWIMAFARERPLYKQFPIRLVNVKSVPGIHVTCSCCNGQISGDRVRGRVTQSLPHVVTVSANGYCAQCTRMTHIDCRFRAQKDETLIEWLTSNGQWQARELRPPTVVEKITRGARRLAAWIATAL